MQQEQVGTAASANAQPDSALDAEGSARGNFVLDAATEETLKYLFTYHAPTDAEILKLKMVRESGLEFARNIMAACPRCADRSAAIRHLREAIMTANASIVLDGRSLA